MAKTILDFAGWELGSRSSVILANGGLSGGLGNFGSGTIVSGQYGRYGRQYKHDTSGGGYGTTLSSIALGGVNTAHIVFRVYFAASQFPVGQNRLLAVFCRSSLNPLQMVGIRMKPGGGIEAGYMTSGSVPAISQGTYTFAQQATTTLCPTKWHRLEGHLDVSGTTWTLDWTLNGRVQPQVQITGKSADTWEGIAIGKHFQSDSSSSGTLYSDDFAVTNDAAQYPLGPGKTVTLWPAANYIFSGDTTKFKNDDGTAIDTNSWQRFAEGSPALGGTPCPDDGLARGSAGDGHYIEAFGPMNTGNALRFTFEQNTLPVGPDIVGINALLAYSGSTAGSTFGLFSAVCETTPRNNATAVVLCAHGELASAANQIQIARQNNHNGNNIGAMIPLPGGFSAWTQTLVNGLYLKFGPDRNAAAETAANYHDLNWYGFEIHLSATDEFSQIGCFIPRLPLLGVG